MKFIVKEISEREEKKEGSFKQKKKQDYLYRMIGKITSDL